MCVRTVVLSCVLYRLLHPSLVQSFVGSHWIGRSRDALMSFTASCSTFIVSLMWSCWWATLMCMVTFCPSTMMTTTIKPSPLPVLYSGCSCRGKVSTINTSSFFLFVSSVLFFCGDTNKGFEVPLKTTEQKYRLGCLTGKCVIKHCAFYLDNQKTYSYLRHSVTLTCHILGSTLLIVLCHH